jgi:hypothetical protein
VEEEEAHDRKMLQRIVSSGCLLRKSGGEPPHSTEFAVQIWSFGEV